MKAIQCELCGSNDVIKQGEYYICQHCKTKYETEAAKRLIVEVSGKVEISNPVDVRGVATVESLLKRAQACLDKKDYEGAENCIQKALEIDPDRKEAHELMNKLELQSSKDTVRKAIPFLVIVGILVILILFVTISPMFMR